MTTKFIPKGVCSRRIIIETDGDIIKDIKFEGGCNGNLQGIGALCIGLDKNQVIEKLKGIKCGFKSTSCPDQLAIALEQIK